MFRALAGFTAAVCAFAQAGDYDQGVARFQKGDLAGAVPFLARAAEAHPRNAQMWKALGVAYAAQKEYARAEPPFRRACELDAKLEDACYFHARALYALDRYEASLRALQRADGGAWKVRLAMAQALEAIGNAGRAGEEFQEALALCRGGDPAPGVAYGLFLVRQGRTGEAIRALDEVLTRYPASADAHTHLGRALLESGKAESAIPHLERAVALAPTSAQAHLLLAKAYTQTGRAAEAQAHFEAAAKYGQER